METMTDDRVDQVYQVDTPAELSLNTVSGHVTVRAGDTDEIHVRATKSGSDRARSNTRVDVQHEGNRVNIHTRAENSVFGGAGHLGRNMASVDYDITVPRNCAVDIKTVSADLVLRGTRARCRLQTVSGDVLVEDVEGASSVTTVSGDVVATRLGGTLTLHSTSGDARVTESNLRDFDLHSVSGDFAVETPLMSGEHYHANTVSGDLRLTVPGGTGVTVQMRSVSGEVVSDFSDAEIIKSGRRHWQGRINGGGANVEMQTVSGDLRIARGSGGGSASPAQESSEDRRAAQVQSNADASAVLSLLEQGEIDVDQALSRLKSLGR